MIKDTVNLLGSYQHFNITCYSCQSKEHIAIECPKAHFIYKRQKIIANHVLNENIFKRDFKRKERKTFHAISDLESIQEAATQFQMIQQNEIYFDNEDNVEVRSYSSIDDIFDRNIYDPQPLVYALDPIQFGAYAYNEEESSPFSLPETSASLHVHSHRRRKKKRQTQPLGEIEIFVRMNYDKFFHNLSIDKVANFEVYFPQNNINKLIVEMDKVRLQKMVESRLGSGAKHLSRLLIKGFKINDRKKQQTPPSSSSSNSMQSLETEKRRVAYEERRVSVMPNDILMYSSKLKNTLAKANDNNISKDHMGYDSSQNLVQNNNRRLSTKKRIKESESDDSEPSNSSSESDSGTGPESETLAKTQNLGTLAKIGAGSIFGAKSAKKGVTINDAKYKPKVNINGTLSHLVHNKKNVVISDPANLRQNHEENEIKRPVALFDFTQSLKKMTYKLEENSKMPNSNRSTSTLKIPNLTLSKSSPVKRAPKKNKNIFGELLRHRNRNVTFKVGRSNSVEDGKDVLNLMQKYGLEEILQNR